MSTIPAAKPLTGRMVLLVLIAFFGVVIAVNVTMMNLAIKTLPGTEVDSSYSASLGYEKEIAAAHDQDARKWQVDAHVMRAADGSATLEVDAHDRAGQPVTGLSFEGRFERPTDKRADLSMSLAEVGIGVYRGSMPAIAPGQWDLVLQGDVRGERMFLSVNRVVLN